MAINKSRWAAIACGVGCALCVALYMTSVRGEIDTARAEALERYGGDQIEVCVAKRDLAAGEIVDSSAIVKKLWVADLLPEGAISDPALIVGQKLGSSIIEGEVVCAQRTELSESSLSVPTGKAAISVPAQSVQAIGGSVKAGMVVDVYATGPVSTAKLLGAALVLATSDEESTSSANSAWITLAVEPDRVQEVVSAAQNLELYFTLPAEEGEPSAETDNGSAGAQNVERMPDGQEDSAQDEPINLSENDQTQASSHQEVPDPTTLSDSQNSSTGEVAAS